MTNKNTEIYWKLPQSKNITLPVTAKVLGHRQTSTNWHHTPYLIDQCINLYWIINGEAEFSIDDKIFQVKDDNFFIQFPGEVLDGKTYESSLNYYWLAIEGPLVMNIAEMLDLYKFRPGKSQKCPVDLFEKLKSKLKHFNEEDEHIISSLCYELMCMTSKKKLFPKKKNEANIEKCINLIEEAYSDPDLNVNMLADELSINRSQLSRTFKKQTGITPSIYIQRLRIKMGLSLLSSNLSIKKIALEVGFRDPAYFSRCISENTGMSPTIIKGRHREL